MDKYYSNTSYYENKNSRYCISNNKWPFNSWPLRHNRCMTLPAIDIYFAHVFFYPSDILLHRAIWWHMSMPLCPRHYRLCKAVKFTWCHPRCRSHVAYVPSVSGEAPSALRETSVHPHLVNRHAMRFLRQNEDYCNNECVSVYTFKRGDSAFRFIRQEPLTAHLHSLRGQFHWLLFFCVFQFWNGSQLSEVLCSTKNLPISY